MLMTRCLRLANSAYHRCMRAQLTECTVLPPSVHLARGHHRRSRARAEKFQLNPKIEKFTGVYRGDITDEYAREKLATLNEEETAFLQEIKTSLQKTEKAPKNISDNDLCYLLENRCKSLNKLMMRKRNKESDKERRIEKKQPPEDKHFMETRLKKSYALQTDHSSMDRARFNDIVHAAQFGPNLIFDIEMHECLHQRGMSKFAHNFSHCHGLNKTLSVPFHYHLMGAKLDSPIIRHLKRVCRPLDEIPYTVSDESFLDTYGKDELVYLTPDATHTMTKYDPSKTYIIGKRPSENGKNYGLHKARRHKIKCQKFPIDRFMRLTTTHLGIFPAVKILGLLSEGKSWEEAFSEGIPKLLRIKAQL